MRQWIVFVIMLMLAGWAASPAHAQNSTIQGQISDQQGAVIPEAHVTATNVATGVSLAAATDQSGVYVFPNLLAGHYQVIVNKPGFGSEARNDVQLNVNQTLALDFSLSVGQATQTVTITGAAPVLDTQTTSIGQVMSNEKVVNLPLNGRNYLQLALLTPGTTPANGSRIQSTGGFSGLGMDAYNASILLDGAVNNSVGSGGELGYEAQIATPPTDAIDQFEVVTNNNSAEYGLRMGPTVITSTKSGTNHFHGDGWEFIRNDAFDAKNYFSSSQRKPPLRQDQFGGTLGGPVFKDRAFFFGSYQSFLIHSGTPAISTLPTAAERAGDFTGQKTIFDPATTKTNPSGSGYVRTAFPNNKIPSARFDPVSLNVIALYPLPNLPGTVNNYYFAGNGYEDTQEGDLRIDYNFRPSERAYMRYSHRMEDFLNAGTLPLPADGASWQTVTGTTHNAVVGLTSTLSSSLVNDFVTALSIFNSALDIPWTQNLSPQLGIKGIPNLGYPNQHGMTAFNPSGYAQVGARLVWPNDNNLDDEELSDKLLYIHGSHTITTGFHFMRIGANRLAERYGRGYATFVGYFTQDPQSRGTTGNSMADFLLGDASSATIGNYDGESIISRNYSVFVQDNWRVTKRLTLNSGLRWDYYGAGTFRDWKDLSNLNIVPGTTGYGQQRFPTSSSDCGCDQNVLNFSPRIGVAYQITPTTVVRAGFGTYYGMPIYPGITVHYRRQAPIFTEVTLPTDQLVQPAIVVQNGFPPNLVPTTTIQTGSAALAFFNKSPNQYALEYFLDVQRQFSQSTVLTLSYMGNGTRHLLANVNANQPLVPGPGAVQGRRPFPLYGSITLANPEGLGNYNAVSAKLEKRYSQGISLLGSYTYSHAIDNNTDSSTGAEGQGFENNYSLDMNRGNSAFDLRHVFVASVVYDLPFGVGRTFMNRSGLLNTVLGDWQAGAIWTQESGPPFTPLLNTDITNVGASPHPNRVANGNLPRGQRNIHRWFDVGAFALPTQYTYGNSGRDILYGPGVVNLDFNVSKTFPIWESTRLEFRAEAFDLMNTPHFNIPNAVVDLAPAGTITSAQPAREVQLAAKFVF